jgi:hypothetical protein
MAAQNDIRYIQSFGPFNMSPNDTQSIIVAQVIARGTSNLNSITELRNLSDHVQSIYDQNFQSVIAIQNISNENPDKFSLSQNYPNPFNPTTNLEFGISELGLVSLKIYDVNGREIQTLVNEKLAPGTYKYQFSTINSQLPSGVYFYRLTAGEFTETKSMILLK